MILILDIDGVVISLRSHYSTGKGGLMRQPDMVAVDAIRLFCERTGAKIVVSSIWRKREHESDFCELMRKCNLRPYFHRDWNTPDMEWEGRGKEIQYWLDAHPEVGEDYIILDDQVDQLLPSQRHPKHLIQCDVDEGMTSENIRTLMKRAGYYKN